MAIHNELNAEFTCTVVLAKTILVKRFGIVETWLKKNYMANTIHNLKRRRSK